MSFVHRIVAGAESRATLRDPPEWLSDALGGGRTTSGQRVSVKTALTLVPFYAGVRLLAESAALCPLVVYSGSGPSRKRDETSPQWSLLHDRPNAEHPPDMFMENIVGHLNLWGNYYARKETSTKSGRRVVGALWPIMPSSVEPGRSSSGDKVFEIEGEPKALGTDKILHIWAFGYDGLRGLSPPGLAREMLGNMAGREEYEGRFYANNAQTGGVIQMPGGFESTRRREAFRQQWDSRFSGTGNSWKTPVLEHGATYHATGLPLRDQEFMLGMRYSVNQTARLLRIPPEMIGGDRESSMTYSNLEAQVLHFVKFSLHRWFVRIEKALKHDVDVFPSGIPRYPEFLIEALLRPDSQARAQFYEIMSRIRALTVNEIRAMENREPVSWGDEPPQPPGAPPAVPRPEDDSGES